MASSPPLKARRPDALLVGTPIRIGQTGYCLRDTGARTAAGLVHEATSYCPGDYVRESLVLQSERIVAAKQSPGDCVGRNNEHAAIAAETHAAVDGTAFERHGGRGRKNTGAGVANSDSPVDDVTPTVYFFGTEDKIRGSVRDEPAVDRGAARNQYSTLVDPQAARYVRSAQDAKIAGVDDHPADDSAGKRWITWWSCITERR